MSATPLTEVSLDPAIEAVTLGRPAAQGWQITAGLWSAIVFALDASMFLAGSLAAEYGALYSPPVAGRLATSTASLLPRGQAYMQRFWDYERLFGPLR